MLDHPGDEPYRLVLVHTYVDSVHPAESVGIVVAHSGRMGMISDPAVMQLIAFCEGQLELSEEDAYR